MVDPSGNSEPWNKYMAWSTESGNPILKSTKIQSACKYHHALTF